MTVKASEQIYSLGCPNLAELQLQENWLARNVRGNWETQHGLSFACSEVQLDVGWAVSLISRRGSVKLLFSTYLESEMATLNFEFRLLHSPRLDVYLVLEYSKDPSVLSEW